MITAFELYFTLKLDAISNALLVLGLTSAAASFSLFMAGIVSVSERDSNADRHVLTKKERAIQKARALKFDKWIPKFFKSSAFALCLSIFFWAFYILTPTTKQMAAIMVIPKIATNENIETLTGEAKSIYELAKEYFSKSVREETF